jgi:hypothetical protein
MTSRRSLTWIGAGIAAAAVVGGLALIAAGSKQKAKKSKKQKSKTGEKKKTKVKVKSTTADTAETSDALAVVSDGDPK